MLFMILFVPGSTFLGISAFIIVLVSFNFVVQMIKVNIKIKKLNIPKYTLYFHPTIDEKN